MTIDTMVLLVGIGVYGVVQLVSLHHARKVTDRAMQIMEKCTDMMTKMYEKVIEG